ncbi:hypothetical protein CsatA_001676 [Cannabis sativa]
MALEKVQWPGFGSKKDKKLVPNSFTIHGLWPQRKKGRIPDCPTTPRFQPNLISKDTRKELDRQWVALNPKLTNVEFWKHEWEKHGTCSNDQLNQVQYFDTALRLKRQYDILKILEAKAIKEKIRYDPIVRCVEKEKLKLILYEIFLCVAKDGSKFEECETSKEDIPIPIDEEEYEASTCPNDGTIIFPKIIWKEDNYCKMMIMK